MFQGEEVFKFYIYQHNVFSLEKALHQNDIKFINEKVIGTNTRSLKYYVKDSDRVKLDDVCKKLQLELFTDSIPAIETRLPEIKLNSSLILLLITIFFIIIYIII